MPGIAVRSCSGCECLIRIRWTYQGQEAAERLAAALLENHFIWHCDYAKVPSSHPTDYFDQSD